VAIFIVSPNGEIRGKEDKAMADEIQRVQYFYTQVPDKPGEGAKVLGALKEAGINLLAFVAFPNGRRAQLDFVPVDHYRARVEGSDGEFAMAAKAEEN
jgi:prephenate dehydratase